jgi:hypothetical protein
MPIKHPPLLKPSNRGQCIREIQKVAMKCSLHSHNSGSQATAHGQNERANGMS